MQIEPFVFFAVNIPVLPLHRHIDSMCIDCSISFLSLCKTRNYCLSNLKHILQLEQSTGIYLHGNNAFCLICIAQAVVSVGEI